MRPGLYGVEETSGGRVPENPGEPAQEPERLEPHDRDARERERQGGGRLVLERHLLARDRDRLAGPRQVQLQRGRQRLPPHERTPGVRDPQQRSQGNPQAWPNEVTPRRRSLEGTRRGGERGAEARPPIAHREAVHRQLGDGDELDQLALAGPQRGGVEGDRHRPER
jgi:hypothetical protein